MLSPNRLLIGQFQPGEGFTFRLDPRTKIAIALLIMAASLVRADLRLYLVLIAGLLVWLLSCRLGWRRLLGHLMPIGWFIAFTALFHIIFSGRNDPNIVFSVWSLTVSQTALSMAATFSARILIFVLSTFIISLTTSPMDISEAAVSLLKPLRFLRVPVYDLGMILFIALRFIPVLSNEFETIRKAQFIRGVSFTGSRIRRIRQSTALLLPVFFSALRRADDLSVAIETRGYVSGQPRSSLYPLHLKGLDYLFLLGAVILFVVYLFVLRWL